MWAAGELAVAAGTAAAAVPAALVAFEENDSDAGRALELWLPRSEAAEAEVEDTKRPLREDT